MPKQVATRLQFFLDYIDQKSVPRCSLSPLCVEHRTSFFGRKVPFCHLCFNWLPLPWQREMLHQLANSSSSDDVSFFSFVFAVRRCMSIKPSQRLLVRNSKTGRIIQSPQCRPSFSRLGVEPRGSFSARIGLSDSVYVSAYSIGRGYEQKREMLNV